MASGVDSDSTGRLVLGNLHRSGVNRDFGRDFLFANRDAVVRCLDVDELDGLGSDSDFDRVSSWAISVSQRGQPSTSVTASSSPTATSSCNASPSTDLDGFGSGGDRDCGFVLDNLTVSGAGYRHVDGWFVLDGRDVVVLRPFDDRNRIDRRGEFDRGSTAAAGSRSRTVRSPLSAGALAEVDATAASTRSPEDLADLLRHDRRADLVGHGNVRDTTRRP